MLTFLARRLLGLILTLFAVSLVVFGVLEVLPGDVAEVMLGTEAREDTLAALRSQLGLDRPAHVRYFAWIGGLSSDTVYYYRIHSPVILIEFDHQKPIAMRHLLPDMAPNKQHIHVVIRTPNGNDYGKDLLRQHYESRRHKH